MTTDELVKNYLYNYLFRNDFSFEDISTIMQCFDNMDWGNPGRMRNIIFSGSKSVLFLYTTSKRYSISCFDISSNEMEFEYTISQEGTEWEGRIPFPKEYYLDFDKAV